MQRSQSTKSGTHLTFVFPKKILRTIVPTAAKYHRECTHQDINRSTLSMIAKLSCQQTRMAHASFFIVFFEDVSHLWSCCHSLLFPEGFLVGSRHGARCSGPKYAQSRSLKFCTLFPPEPVLLCHSPALLYRPSLSGWGPVQFDLIMFHTRSPQTHPIRCHPRLCSAPVAFDCRFEILPS